MIKWFFFKLKLMFEMFILEKIFYEIIGGEVGVWVIVNWFYDIMVIDEYVKLLYDMYF